MKTISSPPQHSGSRSAAARRTLYSDPLYGLDLRTAHAHAARLGLCPADCEDCAMEFLLRQLQTHGASCLPVLTPALRNRSAINHAKNALRSQTIRCRYETAHQRDAGRSAFQSGGAAADTPEPTALRGAFWDALTPFVARLQPVPRRMFLRHYREDESVQDLAAAFGESLHGVEQKLYRARQRLKKLLEEQGIDALELFGYL